MLYIELSSYQHWWHVAQYNVPHHAEAHIFHDLDFCEHVLNPDLFLLEAQIVLQLLIFIATTKLKLLLKWQASLKCPISK